MRRFLGTLALVLVSLLLPGVAQAHPLGNFTVNRSAAIVLSPGAVRVEYVVDMAEIPTVQIMPSMDSDGDGRATEAERTVWASRTAAELQAGLRLLIGGSDVVLEAIAARAIILPGQAGLDTLRLEVTYLGRAPARGELTFADDNFADRIGWREVTAIGIEGSAIATSDVPARSISDGLRTYPDDLLSSPLDVRGANVSFEPGEGSAPLTDRTSSLTARAGIDGGAFAGLVGRRGPFMLFALLLAFSFGALHALGPGHGKTLMAAYLVGSSARVRQAIVVGGSVALMHTASVLALGFAVLTATELFAPERVYPWLGLSSGLIAVGLGAGLLLIRLRASGTSGTGEHHGHVHHGLEERSRHEHRGVGRPALSRPRLVALAVAGGILPSPTALVVLLASVAVDRVAYGLALIAAFSLGLASALVLVGLVALRARDAVTGRLSSGLSKLLPVVSASAIVVVGLVLSVRGLAQV